MKKEYLILALIIAGLCAYLLIHNDNRNNYSLPELKPLAGSDITGITIERKDGPIMLTKTNGVWGVTKKSYPADTDKIKALVKTISTLKITALISEKGDLQRYQLDPENRIKVTATGKKGVLRTFEVGKLAPSYHHTFVKLAGDTHVYHAHGTLRQDVDTDVDGLRDKKVMAFDQTTIQKIKLTSAGITRFLVTTSKKKATKASSQKDDKAPQVQADKKIWQFKDNTPCDEASIKKILSSLSSLECNAYSMGDDKKVLAHKTPVCQITFTGKKEITFSLFKKNSNGKYPALSSTSPFPFVLDSYSGKNILSSVETLLGIKKKENTSQEN